MKKSALLFLFIALVSSLCGIIPYRGEKCILKSEFIYKPGDVDFSSCHASTIIEVGEDLMTAWFGGTDEGNPDVGIWISRYINRQWSKPVEVANGIQAGGKRYPCWNPVLYFTGEKILLFYKAGPSPSSWWGELITSDDKGQEWSEPQCLPSDIFGPVKNKPLLLPNGVLLCPSSTENDGWRVHMEFTSDNGLTWERTPPLNDKRTRIIQPSLIIHTGGMIQMLCRSKSSVILSSWSDDNGHTWSEFNSSGLPNPDSGIDAVSLKDGKQLLVYNHLTKGRHMLNVAISDNGKDWKAAALLENDIKSAEYSYPAIIQTKDGLVHITYTWNRKQIKHTVIDPGKIITRPFINGEWPDEN
jgi:predicted neuraminidase